MHRPELIMSVGPLTTNYLLRCGYQPDHIAGFSGNTRLLHDMGLFGDDANEELSVLTNDFQVDLSKFHFRKYFPGETGWDHFILTFLKNTRLGRRVMDSYPPITLDMIEEVMDKKKWVFD